MKIVPSTPENLGRAALILKQGGVVILPTETVYGIACDATNPEAVRKVYAAKSRPASNPLIVHVASTAQARRLVAEWPREADILTRAFWPGPLTIVAPKSLVVPDEVTAGLDTVALRMPDHPVALEVIRRSGLPLAAPSANRFMRLSPTSVMHLDPSLVSKVDLVLDGGPCSVGLESTVIDVSSGPPRLLRPGGLARFQIEEALGTSLAGPAGSDPNRSPGMSRRHYSPHAKLKLVKALKQNQTGLTFGKPYTPRQIKMPMHPRAYGAALFDALHNLDSVRPRTIYVEAPPMAPAWEAVWDRLRRASEEA